MADFDRLREQRPLEREGTVFEAESGFDLHAAGENVVPMAQFQAKKEAAAIALSSSRKSTIDKAPTNEQYVKDISEVSHNLTVVRAAEAA